MTKYPPSTLLQVVYRQNWPGRTSVVETNKTSVELLVPSGEDYLIEIKVLSDGGDGSSSGPIRIPKMSSKSSLSLIHQSCVCMDLLLSRA